MNDKMKNLITMVIVKTPNFKIKWVQRPIHNAQETTVNTVSKAIQ